MQTTTSIGCRCTGGNVRSRAVLIAQTLSHKHKTKRRNGTSHRHCQSCKPRARDNTFHQTLPESSQLRKNSGDKAATKKLTDTKAAIARGLHLYPFRTEKLNPAAPMVLRKRESRSPPPSASGLHKSPEAFFYPNDNKSATATIAKLAKLATIAKISMSAILQ